MPPQHNSSSVATAGLRFLDQQRRAAGFEYRILEYELSGPPGALRKRHGTTLTGSLSYGEQVAQALGVEPERLFKTLMVEVDGAPVLAMVPVILQLSLKNLARAASGKRAELMEPAAAERLTGYVTGGISPFGQKRTVPAFLDETAGLFGAVVVSGGKRGLQVELSPKDLQELLGATLADLAV